MLYHLLHISAGDSAHAFGREVTKWRRKNRRRGEASNTAAKVQQQSSDGAANRGLQQQPSYKKRIRYDDSNALTRRQQLLPSNGKFAM